MSAGWTYIVLVLVLVIDIRLIKASSIVYDNQPPSRTDDEIDSDIGDLLHEFSDRNQGQQVVSQSQTQQLASLSQLAAEISGVAVVDGLVYVTLKRSSSIQVYDSSVASFPRLEDILVDGLMTATDMVADRDRKLLYISDMGMRIWKIDLTASTSTELTKTPFSPISLSFCQLTNQLIVLASGIRKVFAYDFSDGQVDSSPKFVKLPNGLQPLHAVRLANGNYLVAHTGLSKLDRQHDQVTEISVNGKVVSSYGGWRGSGRGQLDTPRHLAVRADGSVLVADRMNGRVVQLTSQLTFSRIVVEGIPVTRLALDEQKGLLIAGLLRFVEVFQI